MSYQKKAVIEKAFREKALLADVQLPLVTDDTVFYSLFPHRTEPHLVWMDKTRLVRAITGHEAVQAQDMDAFVKGEDLSLPRKQEVMDKDIYFSRTPLMANQYGETKARLQGYSYFGLERPSILSQVGLAYYDASEETLRIKAVNSSLRKLYQTAYQQIENFHPAQLIINAGDPRVTGKTAYCYEVILRDSVKEKAYRYMQEDLDRYLGFKSSLHLKKQNVLILQRLPTGNRALTEVKEKLAIDNYHANGKHVFQNVQLRFLVPMINQSGQFSLPLVDETGFGNGINLTLTDNTSELSIIQRDFEKAGLRIVKGKRRIPVIRLEAKKSSL